MMLEIAGGILLAGGIVAVAAVVIVVLSLIGITVLKRIVRGTYRICCFFSPKMEAERQFWKKYDPPPTIL
jgi:hypothetical protein